NDPLPQQVSPLTKQTLPGPHSALLVHGCCNAQVGMMHAVVPSVVWLHRQPLFSGPHGVKLSQVHVEHGFGWQDGALETVPPSWVHSEAVSRSHSGGSVDGWPSCSP